VLARHRDALLEELRTRRAAAAPASSGVADLAAVLDRFWAPAADLPERLAGPRTPPDALLDQVPDFPITVRGRQVAELLRPAYRALGVE
jgi:hypothetical protein